MGAYFYFHLPHFNKPGERFNSPTGTGLAASFASFSTFFLLIPATLSIIHPLIHPEVAIEVHNS